MPFEEAAAATAASGVLCNKYGMSSHWSLLAVVGNHGRSETFGYEILSMFADCSQTFPCNIFSVNHKGDSDSTGAVTGNILGAVVGYDAIPEFFKTDLELHDVILHVADDLWRGCTTKYKP